jgi:hypothetical protein
VGTTFHFKGLLIYLSLITIVDTEETSSTVTHIYSAVLWDRYEYCGSGSGSDFGKVLVAFPEPDNI